MSRADERYADKVAAMDDYEALAEVDRLANKLSLFGQWTRLAPKDYAIVAPIVNAARLFEAQAGGAAGRLDA